MTRAKLSITKGSGSAVRDSTLVDRRSSTARAGAGEGVPERREVKRVLNAMPDVPDFRDQVYLATLVEVPSERPLASYFEKAGNDVPILDQGTEGACTGYALAAVAHYLLRTRKTEPSPGFSRRQVSPQMLYTMARRYDEWPGEEYSGSSARGAMKAWHKHGVCQSDLWGKVGESITTPQADDARHRPLGAYYRVNHRDLVSMHAALAEVGILYASARVHSGWRRVTGDGIIEFRDGTIGGHAFAIVGYDQDGFWIQNSWGDDWGLKGFARISYDDWLQNGSDVWVARLGVPLTISSSQGFAEIQSPAASASKSYSYSELRSHIVSIGNDGRLRDKGTYGTDKADVNAIVDDIVAKVSSWPRKRILLYAHGGLVSEEGAVEKVAQLRASILDQGLYPVSLIWKTDYLTTMKNILDDASRRRRPEGALEAAKDFMLDRADDMLEPLARTLTGKAAWTEMKENARLATEDADGGAKYFLDRLTSRIDPKTGQPFQFEFHVVGHSAGSIVHASLAQYLCTTLGRKIATCTLWAPACNMKLFEDAYAPLVDNGSIGRFTIFALSDAIEQDDNCANIYHKSLLYLVSHAFEKEPRIPIAKPNGTPILGMEKFLKKNKEVQRLTQKRGRPLRIVYSPNSNMAGSPDASRSVTHGGFDDDDATLRATLAIILGQESAEVPAKSGRVAERARRVTRAWLEMR